MIQPGSPAPDFTLMNHDGTQMSLSDHRGQWVMLWWYPEASSGGCSIQAASIQGALPAFVEREIVVLGASFNNAAQNTEFSCAASLEFPLLCDPNHEVGAAYGVVREPGEPYDDKPRRATFLIDPDGVVAFSEVVPPDAVNDYATRALGQIDEVRSGEKS